MREAAIVKDLIAPKRPSHMAVTSNLTDYAVDPRFSSADALFTFTLTNQTIARSSNAGIHWHVHCEVLSQQNMSPPMISVKYELLSYRRKP
jgi:hypothetical protein